MAVKIISAGLVMISCGLFGFYFANIQGFRISELNEFKKALIILKSEIEYANMPLPKALLNISEKTSGKISDFFKNIAKDLDKKTGFAIMDIWKKNIGILKKTYLEGEDIDYIISLGHTLGYLDKPLQINSIEMMTGYIENKILVLDKENIRNKKMYGSLGILLGLMIVVVLI